MSKTQGQLSRYITSCRSSYADPISPFNRVDREYEVFDIFTFKAPGYFIPGHHSGAWFFTVSEVSSIDQFTTAFIFELEGDNE